MVTGERVQKYVVLKKLSPDDRCSASLSRGIVICVGRVSILCAESNVKRSELMLFIFHILVFFRKRSVCHVQRKLREPEYMYHVWDRNMGALGIVVNFTPR
jgi:hypothetical protein